MGRSTPKPEINGGGIVWSILKVLYSWEEVMLRMEIDSCCLQVL